MAAPTNLHDIAGRLQRAGFVAADQEASELVAAAGGDAGLLGALLARRLTGEPLAWITGSSWFCGLRIRVDPGVYVPRWHSQQLARNAVERLPAAGIALDLCTGTGAIATVLRTACPKARVLATDLHEPAVFCAAANGVEVYRGDLFSPLPDAVKGHVDVVVAVVPYVPTPALAVLQRDTLAFESSLSYDGGPDGTEVLRRVLAGGPSYLRRGGALLVELGGAQAEALQGDLERLGFVEVVVLHDQDGDVRGLAATFDQQR